MAVLGATSSEAVMLNNTVKNLGSTYGGTFTEIQEGLITLGRAGVSSSAGLSEATRVLKELAMITGDSMADGAAIMSSLINVFGRDSAKQIRETGDQMAYVANETRLGIKDFSTISNYALTSAKALGITQEAFLALSGALSKVGLNASTIGTSIRRLQKIVDDASDANTEFFRILGVGQKQFAALLRDARTSEEALGALTSRLSEMNDVDFNRATKQMDVLVKQTVVSLREIGKKNYYKNMMVSIDTTTGQMKALSDQAKIMSVGFGVAMERIWNTTQVAIGGILTGVAKAITGFEEFNDVELNRLNNQISDSAKRLQWLLEDSAKFARFLVMIKNASASDLWAWMFPDKKIVEDNKTTMKQLEKQYKELEKRVRKRADRGTLQFIWS